MRERLIIKLLAWLARICAVLLFSAVTFAQQKDVAKVTPKPPPATVEVPEIDSLKLHGLQLDASGRRARADALNAQAVILNSQAAEIEKQTREMFVRICKALGVNPDEYDGQFSERGLTLVRHETAAAKP